VTFIRSCVGEPLKRSVMRFQVGTLMIVKNECSNGPWGLERHVRHSIAWISAVDLDGIACIRLKNEIDATDVVLPQSHEAPNDEKVSVTGLYLRRGT